MRKIVLKNNPNTRSRESSKKELAKKDAHALNMVHPSKVNDNIAEDISVIEATFKKEKSIGSLLAQMLSERLGESYDSIHTTAAIKDSLRYCFNRRAGNLLYGLIRTSPENSAQFMKKYKVSQEIQNWVKTCFILFGPKLSRLEALNDNPNDWHDNGIVVFYDTKQNPWAKLSITKITGDKLEVTSEYESIFRLMLGLLGNLLENVPSNHNVDKDAIKRFNEIANTFNRKINKSES